MYAIARVQSGHYDPHNIFIPLDVLIDVYDGNVVEYITDLDNGDIQDEWFLLNVTITSA